MSVPRSFLATEIPLRLANASWESFGARPRKIARQSCRVVAVRSRDGSEWCPFFGRIDLVRHGELAEPEADDAGSVLVLVERIPAVEFSRRLTDAAAGRPLLVGGVALHEHRMDKEWYGHTVDSADSPGELWWPALDVRTFRLRQG